MAVKRPREEARRIPSGVPGLDALIGGGLVERSANLVVGSSGAGKTTFALQFLMKGLEAGDEGIYVSLDENKDQILKEAEALGWTGIRELVNAEKVVFIDASGRKFSQFIKKELPAFVEEWRGMRSRVVIDPLTPVIWAVQDRYEQREMLSFLLKETRKVGTVMCTLEEHGSRGDLMGPETVIPLYLSDAVVHLHYAFVGDRSVRLLRVIKFRRSDHSTRAHPYRILSGIGVSVMPASPVGERTRAVKAVELLRQVDGLNPKTLARLVRAVEGLTDDDLEGIDIEAMVMTLVREAGGR